MKQKVVEVEILGKSVNLPSGYGWIEELSHYDSCNKSIYWCKQNILNRY